MSFLDFRAFYIFLLKFSCKNKKLPQKSTVNQLGGLHLKCGVALDKLIEIWLIYIIKHVVQWLIFCNFSSHWFCCKLGQFQGQFPRKKKNESNKLCIQTDFHQWAYNANMQNSSSSLCIIMHKRTSSYVGVQHMWSSSLISWINHFICMLLCIDVVGHTYVQSVHRRTK